MNRLLFTALCLTAAALCSCASGDKKKSSSKSLDEVKLSERMGRKPDADSRSHYEKYLPSAMGGKGSAGSQFQKQVHRSATFAGTNNQAKGFEGSHKTKQSTIGRLKFWGKNSAFAEAGKTSSGTSKTFDPGAGSFNTAKAASGAGKVFSGASDSFGTKSALSGDTRTTLPNAKSIDSISTTNSYSEDEVKKLLNRN